jgi:hypothetical protein
VLAKKVQRNSNLGAAKSGGKQSLRRWRVSMADAHGNPKLVGSWIKVTTVACAEKYPATLEFAAGTYRGTRGPGQGMIWWDAGIYRHEDPSTLVVSTATDELASYPITYRDNEFEFTDANGCRVTYRRS